MNPRPPGPLVAALAGLLAAACGGPSQGNAEAPAQPLRRTLEVVASHPHDPGAWTQGLVMVDERLFESTGLRGRSSLREVDLSTGRTTRRADLPPPLFGEGLAAVGDRLVQLTWQEHVARVYDRDTFELRAEHEYPGEGWGLCHDGRRLVMSDGSSRLHFRDPQSFAPLGHVEVRRSGTPLERLNELECVGGRVWANVLGADQIVEVDPGSGDVVSWVDASGLLGAAERRSADVLNGIAWRASTGTFLLTGKFWPRLFEVRLSPPA